MDPASFYLVNIVMAEKRLKNTQEKSTEDDRNHSQGRKASPADDIRGRKSSKGRQSFYLFLLSPRHLLSEASPQTFVLIQYRLRFSQGMALAWGTPGNFQKMPRCFDSGFLKRTIVHRAQDGTGPAERCWDKISDRSSSHLPQPTLQLNSGHVPATEMGKFRVEFFPFGQQEIEELVDN